MSHQQQDQGWAWMVLLAGFIVHCLIFSVMYGIGAFNLVFLEEFGESGAATAWIGSINTGVAMFSCFPSSILANKYGCRPVTIVGGILCSIGFISSMFATSIYYLYVSFGAVLGFGLGATYMPTIKAVTMYFEAKRTLAIGLTVSGAGIGLLFFPVLYRYMVDQYGWRQSMLICGAIMLNLCACGVVYFPMNIESSSSNSKTAKVLHVSMLRKEKFTKLCINNTLYFVGASSLYLHIPAYAKSVGNSDDSASMLISITGIANFVGRISFGVLGNHDRIPCVLLYNIAFLTLGICTFMFPLNTSYNYISAYSAILGFLGAAGGTLLPSILVEFVGINRMANAYGFLILVDAIGGLIGGPVAGWIYDYKQVYYPAFYFAAVAITLSGLVMLIPALKEKLRIGGHRTSTQRTTCSKKVQLNVVKGSEGLIITYVLPNKKKERELPGLVSHV